MEKSSELSKGIACCIVYQIIQDKRGYKYICEAKERYSAVIQIMRMMLKNKLNQRIIIRILKTFLRLSENKDAKNILKNDFLKEIKDKNFFRNLDDSSTNLLNNLLKKLNEKEDLKEIKNYINGVNNNNTQNNPMNNMKSNINQQLNKNNEDIMNHNINNNNIMMTNQLNQMKMQNGFMRTVPSER